MNCISISKRNTMFTVRNEQDWTPSVERWKTRISRYRCAKVASRDGYSVARHSSWLFRLFIAIVWQTGNGTMADTLEQRDGRAGIAASRRLVSPS